LKACTALALSWSFPLKAASRQIIGNDCGHVAIGVDYIYKVCEDIKAAAGEPVIRA